MPGMLPWLSFAGILAALLNTAGKAEQVNENNLKAAYVYNLAKFVEWPPQSFQNATDPIVICVLGESPVQNALAEAVNGERIDDRKLVVYRYAAVQQMGHCHLLFIASSERKHLRSILRDPKTSGMLTVGETADFLEEGGAVNFRLEGNRVRIEVNMNAVEQRKLRISPKLLSLAQIVRK
jgi:hypothetical protein